MKKTLTILFILLICCIFAADSSALFERFPSPTGFVNDYAGVLSESTKTQMEKLLTVLEKKTTAEVVVVIVKTTSPLSIGQYAVELFQKWGIGKKGEDNGVLILVASMDRKVRIEVGYGLEGNITDAHSKLIIEDLMIPQFKEGDYNKGVAAGVVMIAKMIVDKYGVALDFKKEAADLPLPAKGMRRRSPLGGLLTFIFFILIFGLRFGTLFFFMSGRGGGYWSGGGRGSFGGGFGGFGGGMSGGGGASGSW